MVRAAVIGTGNMGKNHVRTYSKIANAELVAVCDLDEVQGKAIAKKYGTKYYKDLNEMLTSCTPDVVSVCVPTAAHFEVAKKVLEKKINVLVEKPIASNVEEAKDLLRIAKKNNVMLMVGHIERFNPAVRKAKEMIDRGELGKISAITIRRVGGFPPQIKDASIAVDLAIHDIDIANYLLDELPVEVFSNRQRYHIEKREDSIELFMKYKKKASVYIQANWISPVKIRKLNITGTEGYLELDYITQKIEFYKSNYNKFKQASEGYSDYILLFSDPDKISIAVAKKEPLQEEISFFIKAFQSKELINSQYAVDALKIALI